MREFPDLRSHVFALDESQVLVLSRGGQQWILQAQEVAIRNDGMEAVSKHTVWYSSANTYPG